MFGWMEPLAGVVAAQQAQQQSAHEAIHGAPAPVAQGDAPRDAPASPGLLGSMMQSITDLGRGIGQEGLAGVLDPQGMLDRQAAQRELASRFHVRKEGEAAPKDGLPPGNNVSEAEFEQIAKQYSDIRLGRGDLKLDTAGMKPENAAKFEQDTMGDIADLLQTPSGRTLIDKVDHQKDHHTTTIHRRADNSNAKGGAEAGSVPGSWADKKGTNAQVTYVPGADGGIVNPNASDEWMPMRSDVSLFHELTHAYHAAYGTLDTSTLAKGPGVDADDVGADGMEYQAVGLGKWADDPLTENAYRDQRFAIGVAKEGTRSVGGVSDYNMPHRDNYNIHNKGD